MTDIEGNPTLYSRVPTTSSTTAQPTSIDNPYAESPRMKRSTADRILKYVRNTFYIALSTYVLHRFFRFYDALFHSPYISHEWFKIGIALTVAQLGIKAYVEIYEGRVNKAVVEYKNFPQCTHAMMILFSLSSVAYHVALWPHYHSNTFIVLGIVFFGVLVPFLLITPSSVQNIMGFVLLALFLQGYQ